MGGRADVPEFDYRGPGGLANEGELEDSILALSEEKIAPRREHREPIDARTRIFRQAKVGWFRVFMLLFCTLREVVIGGGDLLHHFGRTCAERG
jgi:hypothetical protein